MAHAIDKQGIVEGILGGYDAPLDELTSPVSFGFVEGIKAPDYNPEKAKELVAEVGDEAKLRSHYSRHQHTISVWCRQFSRCLTRSV
ncbi:hypothetical protein HGG75_14475 [Ochrobactrum pseudogrignonense]|nr:hypothetical protein [Brucella pseudogrignonensis]